MRENKYLKKLKILKNKIKREKRREKQKGEAEKDETQGEKKKKWERETFFDIGSMCGSPFF